MTKVLVDTSILIEAQRNALFLPHLTQKQSQLTISRITTYELLLGSRNAAEKKRNTQFVDFLPILELNESISQLTYSLIEKYGLKTKLTIPDALIAATALMYKCPLWTLNHKHFRAFKDLTLYSPSETS